MATVAVLAGVLNRVVRRGDQRLASQREIAEAAQRAVLPRPDDRIGGFEIAVRYEAAQRDAFIGGDGTARLSAVLTARALMSREVSA